MLTAVMVLAVVAGVLAIISLFPQASQWPLLSVAALLLSICVFLLGGGGR